MSIIVITIPDSRKQAFVADLQARSGGAVDLVILQERPPRSWRERWQAWCTRGFASLFSDIYYGLCLRLAPAARRRLAVFQAQAGAADPAKWAAPVLRVADVNDPVVAERIRTLKPDVLAVWGCGLIAHETVILAPTALNVHLGISTHYRGAYANQRAVERGDFEHMGATIHHINGRADSGAVVATIRVVPAATAAATFSRLHDEVEVAFVDAVTRYAQGESVPATVPDITQSENLRLRDWTPRRRWRLAQQLRRWPATSTPLPPDTSPV